MIGEVNTMTFSSLGKEVTELMHEKFKSTNEKCSEHGIYLVQFNDRQPFCPICAEANTKQSEKEFLEEETRKAHESNKRWLKTHSITVDKKVLKATFENFQEVDEETRVNKEKALNIARAYYKGNKHNSMFAGKFGTGKTHLAVAILNQLNEASDVKCMFVSLDELMAKIKAGFNQRDPELTEEQAVYLLSQPDYLVLDDLGAETGAINRDNMAGDFTVRVLNGILNGRMSKPTIFTTNFSSKKMRKVYDGRIMSRIMRGVNEDRVVRFEKTTDKRSQIEF